MVAVSLVYDGLEWVYRPAMPAFWRASLRMTRAMDSLSGALSGAALTSSSAARDGIPGKVLTRCVLPMSMSPVRCLRPGKRKLHRRDLRRNPGAPLSWAGWTASFASCSACVSRTRLWLERYSGKAGRGRPILTGERAVHWGVWESRIEKPDYLVPSGIWLPCGYTVAAGFMSRTVRAALR